MKGQTEDGDVAVSAVSTGRAGHPQKVDVTARSEQHAERGHRSHASMVAHAPRAFVANVIGQRGRLRSARDNDGVTGYPLLLDLQGRDVLVVGGGAVATRRVAGLVEAGAAVRVVAPDVADEIVATGAEVSRRAFVTTDVAGAWLVHACTSDPAVNEAVAAAGLAQRIPCVRADEAAGGTARTPAVARRGEITVAVNAGDDPRRAMALRDAIALGLDAGDLPVATTRPAATGSVALVGGGPGDPELITVRGRRLLAEADVVVVDRLAPRDLLAELAPSVEVIDCGKSAHRHNLSQAEINEVIVDRARGGGGGGGLGGGG
jgi:uroporphyrin-III C-methyltransferase / precorrin-2 dehydrogenase / sirohydrochlorin ferrochelatase